jgi:FkbM family methyltransferase
MRIIPGNIAILDAPDQLCAWVEEAGALCHDGGVAKYYLPHINPGDAVIDAGAAIGDHTIAYMEKVGASGVVHAFECNSDMLECLIHNCPLAMIYPVALSDKDGTLGFTEEPGNAGANFTTQYLTETKVPCRTLDSYSLPRVDFIKWDIEGSEVRALNGARETIARCRPRMIVEFNELALNRQGATCSELESLIVSLGYSVECIMGTREEGRYEGLCLPK